MPPIRVLRFADIHIGMENYGRIDPGTGINKRVIDFLRRFDEVIDYGLAHDVDLVIFAGDAFKTRDPSPTLQREFARRIKRLADAGVPLVMLVGNHDLPVMEKKASSLDIYRTLGVPNVTVGWQEDLHTIRTKRGLVQVGTVPYPIRSRLLSHADYADLGVHDLDHTLQEIVGDNLRALGAQIDARYPAIVTGHFTVSGAVYGSERSVMLGGDVPALKSVLTDGPWDYVALGHIHKHQNLNVGGYPAVVYPGSLERIDFGEEHEPKGFCWVELTKGATTWQFVPVAARPFVTVEVDGRQAADATSAVLATLAGRSVAGAIVRVVVQLRSDQDVHEAPIRAALRSAEHVAGITRKVEQAVRVRLADVSMSTSLTPGDLLARYLAARQTSGDRTALLMHHAAELMGLSGQIN